MSDKAEAAQKWAEAKAALDAAETAYGAAKEAYRNAEDAEFHAWQALEALAGRTSVSPEIAAIRARLENPTPYVTLPPLPDAAGTMLQSAHRHSLPQEPIG